MARKEKPQSSGPNLLYLVSFGDTMTALLAFFIVMNSLAKEQTGADIHSGTGSFIEITNHLGVPGIFDDGMSRYRLQMKESSPLYMVPDDEGREPEHNGSGPDEDGDNSWIRDREQEDYERFLIELERLQHVRGLPRIAGEVSFDRMKHLPSEGPLFDAGMREMIVPLAPQFRNPNYEVEVVVWSPTPSKSAWTRTTLEAYKLREEIVAAMQLPGADAARLTAVAKPWLYSDIKRPVVTVTVRKITRD